MFTMKLDMTLCKTYDESVCVLNLLNPRQVRKNMTAQHYWIDKERVELGSRVAFRYSI